MNLSIRVFYRSEFLPIVCAFIQSTAQVFGASEKERSELSLAAEEAAMHIIESCPPDNAEDVFEIACHVLADGLEYVFQNLGLPLNVEALPQYDAADPEASVAGLRLYLARKMVDRLEFINRGRQGWLTKIHKKIQNLCTLSTVIQPESAGAPAGGLTASIAGSADAWDIVQLAYLTYRYSYAKDYLYYPEQLAAEIESKRMVSAIVRTAAGTLIGHTARILDADCPKIAEIGAIMVHPDYRQSPALLMMKNAMLRYQDEYTANIQLYVGILATAHPLSQRIAAREGYKPFSLWLSSTEPRRYLGIQTSAGRESHLYAVQAVRKPAPFPIHVPELHTELSAQLFASADLPAVVDSAVAAPVDKRTVWSLSCNQEHGRARLVAQNYGADFVASLRVQSHQLLAEGVKTTMLLLPAWQRPPKDLEEQLAIQFYLFCGFIPFTPEQWHLLYIRLTNQHFSSDALDAVQIWDPAAEELRAHIRQGFARLSQDQPS